MAQLDITTRNDTFLVAPVFPYPQVSSWGAHKSANSYRWWGCAAANTVWNIYNGMNQAPFDMIEAVYDSDAIYVAFRTPCPPLIKRPFYYVSGQKITAIMDFPLLMRRGPYQEDHYQYPSFPHV